MDKRFRHTVVICDTDLDHSFTLEGNLKNQGYDVVNITDASELVRSVESLRPSLVLANPDMQGFNEYDVCKKIRNSMGIPVMLIMDRNSTHRALLDDCSVDDVLTKPVESGNLLMIIKKHISLHQQ